MSDVTQTTGAAAVFGRTAFLAEFKRAPIAKRGGMAAWLRYEIEGLEATARTEYGDGALAAYKSSLKELETCNAS